MHPLLRLPCALLALLLSALGGPRFALERHNDGDQPGAPVVVSLGVLPPAQLQPDLPGDWWCPLPTGAPRPLLVAALTSAEGRPAYAAPVQAVPGPRRGSAGGPRAP